MYISFFHLVHWSLEAHGTWDPFSDARIAFEQRSIQALGYFIISRWALAITVWQEATQPVQVVRPPMIAVMTMMYHTLSGVINTSQPDASATRFFIVFGSHPGSVDLCISDHLRHALFLFVTSCFSSNTVESLNLRTASGYTWFIGWSYSGM